VDLLFGAVKPYPSTKMPIDLSKEKELAAAEAAAPQKKSGDKPAKKKAFAFGGKC
jgi:hypothetical protein